MRLDGRPQFAGSEFLSAKLAGWENWQFLLVFAKFAPYHLCKSEYGEKYEMASNQRAK